MNTLLLLLLIVTPLLLLAVFYRLCGLLTRNYKFKNRATAIVYALSIFLSALGFIYYGGYFLQCVWPGRCGEGFASGYIAAALVVGILITSAVYITSEVILFFSVKKRNGGDIA
mgnify:CR=1 FL=1